MKTISIVTACYNEEENVEELYNRIRAVMAGLGRYLYEHIFIDNCSQDATAKTLKRRADRKRNMGGLFEACERLVPQGVRI